jgi:transposase
LHSKLDKLYRQESNPDVKERIQLVRRIIEDKQHIEDVARELHRCRAWAYKWYKRYNDNELDGLKNKAKTGRPSDVSKDVMVKIRKELADSNDWMGFQAGIGSYLQQNWSKISKYISTVCYTSGDSSLKYHRNVL